jgi:multiple sugar transport system permease protein
MAGNLARAVRVPAASVPVTRRPLNRDTRKLLWGLAFISPWVVGFCAFIVFPLGSSLWYSFTNYDLFQPPQWVGLYNYAFMLHDATFWTAMYNTAYLAVFFVPLNIAFGIGLATLLNARVRGLAFYRTLAYLPTIVPAVASAILWLWLLNPNYGVVNLLLSDLHIAQPGWLASPAWSKPAYILMSLWASLGNTMLIFLAGLQGVPQALYEAADLDGAGRFTKFRHITLPMLSPVIFFNLILGIIATFTYFTQAFVITDANRFTGSLGAPLNSALFYSLYLYEAAFSYNAMGYASALAWVLFLMVLLLAIVLFRTARRWVYYETEGK